tara:strand:+ start:800 stop:2068 length:1269 start_codon:yes stop_codon:yes gene_type:complete
VKLTKQRIKQIFKEEITLLSEANMHIEVGMPPHEMKQVIKRHGYDPYQGRDKQHKVMRDGGLNWMNQTGTHGKGPPKWEGELRTEYRAWVNARKCKRKGFKPKANGKGCIEQATPEPGAADPIKPTTRAPALPEPERKRFFKVAKNKPQRFVIPREVVEKLYFNFRDAINAAEEASPDLARFDKSPAWKRLFGLVRMAQEGCVGVGDCDPRWRNYDFLQGQAHKVYRLLGRVGGGGPHQAAKRGMGPFAGTASPVGALSGEEANPISWPVAPKFDQAHDFIRMLLLSRRHVVQPDDPGKGGEGHIIGGDWSPTRTVRSMPSSVRQAAAVRENKMNITKAGMHRIIKEELESVLNELVNPETINWDEVGQKYLSAVFQSDLGLDFSAAKEKVEQDIQSAKQAGGLEKLQAMAKEEFDIDLLEN